MSGARIKIIAFVMLRALWHSIMICYWEKGSSRGNIVLIRKTIRYTLSDNIHPNELPMITGCNRQPFARQPRRHFGQQS